MDSEGTDLLHSQWLRDKITKQESITMVDLATKFKYFCEADADKAFTALISKSFIRNSTSTTLLDKYGVWKRNEGARFWASRSTMLSTTKTAGELVTEGGHVVRELFRENRESATPSSEKASLGLQLSDLLPNDRLSTTPPGSPSHVPTGSTPGSSSTVPLPSLRVSSPTSALVGGPTDTPLGSERLLDCEREELLRGVDDSGHPLCD